MNLSKQSQPLVSVIIPTRNRKKLLRDAVQSVLNQTYHNIQIIVHDNNSKDGTEEMISGLKDSRLEYYKVTTDLSMTDNWSRALGYAHGIYFVRLDDDNVWFPDFIESALREIQNLNLHVMIFSSIIVHLRHNIFTLFNAEEKNVHILNKYQLTYLEYFTLTDSNYIVYNTALVRQLFPGGAVYQTTLPDRYLNYMIAHVIDEQKVRVGISAQSKAITRFDYRPAPSNDSALHYINYGTFTPDDILKEDCHNNFTMHRIATITRFFENSGDKKLRSFFNAYITSESARVTLMQFGHIHSIPAFYSWNDIIVYIHYCYGILTFLVLHPKTMLDGHGALFNLLADCREFIKKIIISIFYILVRKQRALATVDASTGDLLVKKVLNKEYVSALSVSAYGSLSALLIKINTMVTS